MLRVLKLSTTNPLVWQKALLTQEVRFARTAVVIRASLHWVNMHNMCMSCSVLRVLCAGVHLCLCSCTCACAPAHVPVLVAGTITYKRSAKMPVVIVRHSVHVPCTCRTPHVLLTGAGGPCSSACSRQRTPDEHRHSDACTHLFT
jgi:hypothetical protein